MNLRRSSLTWPLLVALGCSAGTADKPPEISAVPPPAPEKTAPPAPTAAQAPKEASPAVVSPDAPSGARAARDAELKKQAEGIITSYSNMGPWLTPDKKKVLFTSNRDGLPQLYVGEVDKPDAPPVRITTTSERISSPWMVPGGKSILFLSDKGADERWSIFRVDIDGKNLVELTPGEDLQRSTPFVPDKASPLRMVYSSRLVSEAKTNLVIQELTSGAKPKIVYTEPSIGSLVDVSRDGKRAALLRVVSTSESWLSVVDLEKGTARPLYPPAGKKVSIPDVSFSADGSRLVLATDEGGDRSVLISLDVETGKETARRLEDRPPTALLGVSGPSKDGRLFAELVNAGNHSAIRLIDQKTLKPVRDIEMPLGAGAGWLFSEDSKTLVATWGTANTPTDIYAADVSTGKVTPLRKDARQGLSGLAEINVSIVEVKAFDGMRIPVNLYLPAGLHKAPKPAPVLVYIHGGPAGSSVVGWDAFRRFHTAQGYVVVEPNVRGSSGFGRAFEMADNGPKREDGIKDIEAVARWVTEQPWADKGKLVIWGGSYGGYSVLMGLTRQQAIWRAGVDLFGVSSWTSFMKTTSGVIRELFLTEIGDPDRDAAVLNALSPLKDAAAIRAPLFVYAGANDIRVPRAESDQIVRVLRDRKVPVEYMVAANEGHSLGRRENQLEFLARSTRFLEEALGLK